MKLKYLFLLSLFTFSCKSQENNLYEFDPRALIKNKISLAEIADEILYIPLDNRYPISDLHSPKLSNNSIYFFTLNGIIAFNREGKMARKIGSRGRGPDEYLSGLNFAVDVKHETIYVLNSDNQIKVYSDHGDFVRSISLPNNIGSSDLIDLYDSKIFVPYYLQFEDAKYDWIILDTLGNIIKMKERSIPPFTSNFGTNAGTYLFDEKLHYWNPYVDTIFSILPDLNYKATFIFSQGEHRLPKSNFNPSKPQNMVMHLRIIFETSRFWVIRYDYIRPIISLVDKKSRKPFLSYLDQDNNSIGINNSGGILNDLDGGVNFEPRCYIAENGKEYMVGLVNPFQIKAHVTSSEFKNFVPIFPEKKKILENLSNSLLETDNPIIVLVRLKK